MWTTHFVTDAHCSASKTLFSQQGVFDIDSPERGYILTLCSKLNRIIQEHISRIWEIGDSSNTRKQSMMKPNKPRHVIGGCTK